MKTGYIWQDRLGTNIGKVPGIHNDVFLQELQSELDSGLSAEER